MRTPSALQAARRTSRTWDTAAAAGSLGDTLSRTLPRRRGRGRNDLWAQWEHPMTALAALIRRDIKIALRVGGGALIGVLFFLTVVVLMPFALGPDLALLSRLGPAILWLGALLASLLTLDRLFMADHEDGSLDLITMSRTPLELACAAKAPGGGLRRVLASVTASQLPGFAASTRPAAPPPARSAATARGRSSAHTATGSCSVAWRKPSPCAGWSRNWPSDRSAA